MTADMSTKASDLNELLRLAFSEPYRWLSEAPKTDQNVNWIALSLEETMGGDIVLLLAGDINSKQLSKADQKEAAAVLILGEEPLPKVTILSDVSLTSTLPVADDAGSVTGDSARTTSFRGSNAGVFM